MDGGSLLLCSDAKSRSFHNLLQSRRRETPFGPTRRRKLHTSEFLTRPLYPGRLDPATTWGETILKLPSVLLQGILMVLRGLVMVVVVMVVMVIVVDRCGPLWTVVDRCGSLPSSRSSWSFRSPPGFVVVVVTAVVGSLWSWPSFSSRSSWSWWSS